MLQEDMLSRASVAERNNLDNEFKEILQPEFIKSIGLSKNGESVEMSSHPSTANRQKRQSRLDRRLECQAQRVVKSPHREPQQLVVAKVDYVPLYTRVQDNVSLLKDQTVA